MPKFCFRSISWEVFDRISPNFIYAFILTRSSSGLLQVIFAHFQSNGPWFAPTFRFRSISWELIDRISPKFIYAYLFTRSTLGLTHFIFHQFVSEVRGAFMIYCNWHRYSHVIHEIPMTSNTCHSSIFYLSMDTSIVPIGALVLKLHALEVRSFIKTV